MPRIVARPLAERLWEKVDRSSGPLFCWLWRGRQTGVYGSVLLPYRPGREHQKVGAHVAAYMVAHGLTEPPNGLRVLHSCDTPTCCNPAHLRLGTAKENSQEMVRKGRNPGPARTRAAWAELRELRPEVQRLRALVIALGGDPAQAA